MANRLKVEELRNELTKRDLVISGTKPTLVCLPFSLPYSSWFSLLLATHLLHNYRFEDLNLLFVKKTSNYLTAMSILLPRRGRGIRKKKLKTMGILESRPLTSYGTWIFSNYANKLLFAVFQLLARRKNCLRGCVIVQVNGPVSFMKVSEVFFLMESFLFLRRLRARERK